MNESQQISNINSLIKPDCYKCIHRQAGYGSHHSMCSNWKAKVVGSRHGYENGWFSWPFDFDPIWLNSCSGFQENPNKT